MFMDVTALIDSLRADIRRSAEVGGADVGAAAERLLLALEPALRLTLMDALSQAAAEIGEALPGVAIHVRLQGREPAFVLETPKATVDEVPESEDGEPVVRITLRLPEALKGRAE